MKKYWFQQLIFTLGVASAATVFGQYPPYNPHTSPSAYPMQYPAQGAGRLTAWQESVPSVPAPGNYAVPQSLAAPYNAQPTIPLPQSHPYGSTEMAAPTIAAPHQPSPMPYAQQQAIAPGCTSCNGGGAMAQPYSGGYAGGYPYAPSCEQNYAYSAPSYGMHAGHGGGFGAGRGAFRGNGLPVGAKPYFFGVNALIFRRIDDHNRLLSINDTTGAGALYTRDAQNPTMPGLNLMVGRYFNCGKNAIAASYWGLFPESQTHSITNGAGNYRSELFRPWTDPLDPASGEYQLQVGGAAMPLTDPDVYNLYDIATTHSVTRSSQFHNLEINLLGFAVGGASRNFNRPTAGTMFSGSRGGRGAGGYAGYGYAGDCGYDCGGYGGDCGYGDCGQCQQSRYATGPCCYVAPACGSKLNLSWLGGIRYMNFNDNLLYSASGAPLTALGISTLNYETRTRNNLLGFQIGGRSDLCLGNRFNLYSVGKVGIFGNHATLRSTLGADGYYAYTSGDPTMPLAVTRSRNNVAFVSDIGTGMGVRLSPKWTATVGYQAIIATGVATAVGNTRYQGMRPSQTTINSTDALILHGLNVGALYNF